MDQPVETPLAQPSGSRRKWLIRLGIAAGLFALVLSSVVIGLLRHYDNEWFKQKIQEELKTALGRHVEIQAVQVQLFSGNVALENVTVLNADTSFAEKHTLKLKRAVASLSVFPLIFSGGKKINALAVDIEQPEVYVEYPKSWPFKPSNIQDLVKKFSGGPPSAWPKQTGLQALDITLTVRGGVLRYKDSKPELGESRFEKFDLSARMPALGQAVEVKSSVHLATLSTPQGGGATVDARIDWIGADGSIDPATFTNILVNATLKEFDLPYLLRHLEIQGSLVDGKFQWAPGRPFIGTFKVEAPTLEAVHVTSSIQTDGAISIIQDGKRIAGNIPGRFDLDIQGGWKNGHFQAGPARFTTFLTATRADLADAAAPRFLDLKIDAGADDGKARKYTVLFKSKLTDLFATDAGTVLGLKGQIGGDLDGAIDANVEQTGRFTAVGKLNTKDGYVAMEGVRQPSSMDMTFSAKVSPNADGIPERADVSLDAKADSFQIKSLTPIAITSLNDPRKLEAQAKLQLKLMGREFWKQFGPLLTVMNMRTPVEEALEGELQLTGSSGRVELGLNATLKRQSDPPTPIQLAIQAKYDGAELVDLPARPFLNFNAKISSEDKSIDLEMGGSATRGKSQQRFDLPLFKNESDLKALTNFNTRFGAYVSVFPGAAYAVSGSIKQKGSSHYITLFGPTGETTGTELVLSTDLSLTKFNLVGPPIKPGVSSLKWVDDNFTLKLGLKLKSGSGGDSLVLLPLELNSDMMTLKGDLAEARVAKLRAALLATGDSIKAWVDALPQAAVEARLSSKAIEQLQADGLIPNEPLYAGEINVKAAYDPKSTSASIGRISLSGPLLNMKASTDEINVPEIAALLKGTPTFTKLIQTIPTIAFSMQAKAAAMPHLQKMGVLPRHALANGDLSANINFDNSANILRLNSIQFASEAAVLNFSAAAMDVKPLATYLDLEPAKRDAIALAGTVPDLSLVLNVKPALIDQLGAGLPAWLRDPALRGDLAFNARYSRADDQIVLEGINLATPLISGDVSGSATLKSMLTHLNASPAEMLSHGLKTMALKNLVITPEEVLNFLTRNKMSPELVQLHAHGTLVLPAPFKVDNFSVKPSATAGAFEVSFRAHLPLTLRSDGRTDTAALSKAIKADGLRITLGPAQTAIDGAINFDETSLSFLKLQKNAGVPCKLQLSAALTNANVLHLNSLDLTSEARSLALTGATYDLNAPQPRGSFNKMVVQDGALRGTFIAFNVDMAKDELAGRCEVESIDLGSVIPAGTFDGGLSVTGILSGLAASYTGRISSLRSGALGGTDNLSVVCQKAAIEASRSAGGKIAQINVMTDLAMTPQSAKTAASVATVRLQNGATVSTQTFNLNLAAAPKVATDDLLGAAGKPGMPLTVTINCNAIAALDTVALQEALAILSGPASSQGGSGIDELVVNASFTAPGVNASGIVLNNIKMPGIQLARNNVSITQGQFGIFDDGAIVINRQMYGLATAAHSGDIQFSNINLHTASGGGAGKTKDDYQLYGRALGTSVIDGAGFDSAALRTWAGRFTLTLAGLQALKNGGKASTDATKIGIGFLGNVAGGLLGNRIGQKIDWLTSLYSEDFGLFLNKMEFEDYALTVPLAGGRARIEKSRLTGKGRSAGLQIEISGGIELATQKFSPNLTLWITSLPPTTQKVLRLDQLDATDRDVIMKEFADGNFKPIILTGTVSNYKDNRYDIAMAFNELDNRVEALIQAKKARENPAPAGTAATPPAEKPRANPLNDIFNLINKKK